LRAATWCRVLAPLAIAVVALAVREAAREVADEPTPGRGAPLVPEALVPWIAKRLPVDTELAVDAEHSAARIAFDDRDGPVESYTVAGALVFDARGDLVRLSLEFTPKSSERGGVVGPAARFSSRSIRARATPVAAVRAASASGHFERGAEACEVDLDVRWTPLVDGSVGAQGEGSLALADFDLPPSAWARILRDPPIATLALDLVLARRD
jgi:hypothetical protein